MQRKIREQLRSMDEQKIDFDEYFYEKTERTKEKEINIDEEMEEIMKQGKECEEDNILSIKSGVLRVKTISSTDNMAHGFKITMENVTNKITGDPEPDIKFNTREIYLNPRNFKNSNIDILLQMNKINDDSLNALLHNKQNFRKDLNLKRYTEEITLSSHFYRLVFDNQNVTLLEVFKYFVKFERRKVCINT